MRRALRCVAVLCLLALPVAASSSVEQSGMRLADVVRPSVVQIHGLLTGRFRRMVTAGVLVGRGGIVLTHSARKVAADRSVNVVLDGGARLTGKVIGRHGASGVVAIRLTGDLPTGLEPAGDDLVAGSPVIAAGFPFGTRRADSGPAISQGIVSQVRQTGNSEFRTRYLLSSAVNPGEWGGPLVDRTGRLAGLLAPQKDGPSKLSTAVPISVVRSGMAKYPEVLAALEPPTRAGELGEWPIQDGLRVAAGEVWPAVVGLLVRSAEKDGKTRNATGLIIDPSGYVVTTSPNIEGAGEIRAFLPDGREFGATIVAEDERRSIALLRLDGEDLPYASLSGGELPKVGSFVVTVANSDPAGGSGPMLTMGLVGGHNRDRRYEAIHTDAAINRANAGGPLVDLYGRVVGITTTLGGQTLRSYGVNSGVGFAIPSAAILDQLEQLKAGHSIAYRPGYLGVRLQPAADPSGGVPVTSIEKGHAAEAAGLRVGDVIVAADGIEIKDYDRLRTTFMKFEVGQTIRLKIRRGDEILEIDATLGVWPPGGPR